MTKKIKHSEQRKRIHLALLQEAIRGLKNAAARETLSLKKLKARYGR
jgi:hypothetical protein